MIAKRNPKYNEGSIQNLKRQFYNYSNFRHSLLIQLRFLKKKKNNNAYEKGYVGKECKEIMQCLAH